MDFKFWSNKTEEAENTKEPVVIEDGENINEIVIRQRGEKVKPTRNVPPPAKTQCDCYYGRIYKGILDNLISDLSSSRYTVDGKIISEADRMDAISRCNEVIEGVRSGLVIGVIYHSLREEADHKQCILYIESIIRYLNKKENISTENPILIKGIREAAWR